jgi:DNA-binding IclR family transcriptional regulator
MTSGTNRNRLIASVAATLRLLEVLAESGGPLALAAIAQKSGQPKSTVHRMLASLAHMGYVEQEESSRYRLTFKLLRLGMDLLSSVDIVNRSKPHLEALMRATNESAYLAVLDQTGHSVYLAKVETMRPVAVQAQLGAPNPAWCTTTGWAMLAFLPEVRDKVLAGRLVPRVAGAIADPQRLREALAQVAELGCAVTRAQGNPDTGGIAAPIRNFDGSVVAACSIGVPLYRMDAALVRKCMPLVVQAATAISAELGFVDARRRPRAASQGHRPLRERRPR